MYNKQDFYKHISSIKPKGFYFSKNAPVFVREGDDCKVFINIQSREYYPHGCFIDGVSVHIVFNSVESILKPLYIEEGIHNSDNYTIKNSLLNIKGVNYERFEQEVNSDISFSNIVNDLNLLISAALMFCDKFTTVSDVAEFLSDKKANEIVDWIQGSILFPKTVLILYIAKHAEFNNKREEFYELINVQASRKRQSVPHLNVFKKLFYE
jgi:hypothetical protein